MHGTNCNLMTQDGSFFDITHTFKAGSSTYHVLGLGKDRPTYRNTYYIFNCTNDQHESTNEYSPHSLLFRRSARASGHNTSWSKQRSITPHYTTTTPTDYFAISQPQKTKSSPSHPRARTQSPKKVEIDTTDIKEALTKAMKTERHMLFASLRKEMNAKKKTLLRTIKKQKEVLLQATTEANNKQEIIHLLEEQKISLTNTYEQCLRTTTSSIDALKQTLIETLDTQHNTSQTVEQLQLTLIQTIEQDVQKIVLKNEEILRSTSAETNAINQLQNTLVRKIDDYSTTKKHDDNTTLNRLFAEQKQVLTDTIVQQQQTLSLDLIKQTMLDALNEQQSKSANITDNREQQSRDDSITNISPEQIPINSITIDKKNNGTLPRMISSQHFRNVNQWSSKMAVKKLTDQHLFKVSIRSPEHAHLYAKLLVDGMEYSRRLYTLCQRDTIQNDLFNCYIAPPNKNGPYEVTIYAKTKNETAYRAAISIRLPGSNIFQSNTFPLVHQSFEEHQCILIEPFQRLLRRNEQVLIHMIVPDAHVVKIQNGDDIIELDADEYKNGTIKKKIRVRGDVIVTGCWDKKTDSTICVFNMN